MSIATPSLHRAYRARLDALRDEITRRLEAEFGESIEPEDLGPSFERFLERATLLIEAGQAEAQTLTSSYVALLLDRVDAEPADELEDVVGTNRDGMPLAEAMAAIGPMMLGAIAEGKSIDDALGIGRDRVTKTSDNEVTGAADRESAHQERAVPEIVGWQGIVSPGSCDPCQENAGEHDLDEEFYRHPSCNCVRQLIVAVPSS